MLGTLDASLRTLEAAAAGAEVMSETIRRRWVRRHERYRAEQDALNRCP